MNLQAEKKHHERKLAVIELINLCDEYIDREEKYISRLHYDDLYDLGDNAKSNINRFEKIKSYLLERYNRS